MKYFLQMLLIGKLSSYFLCRPQNLKTLEMYKRLFVAETMLVILEKNIDTSIDEHLPKNKKVWHLAKSTTLEEIDLVICPSNIMAGFLIDWLRDPVTRLPSATLIERKAKEIVNNPHQASIIVSIAGFDKIPKTYKFDNDRDKIEHVMADILEQCIEKYGDSENWIGHAGFGDFYMAIRNDYLESVKRQIVEQFENGIISINLADTDIKQLSVEFDDFPYNELGLSHQFG